MYNLNKDAITNIPTFFSGVSSKPIVTLDVAKEKTVEYFTKNYDFNTKLKNYILKVNKCKSVVSLQQYIYNAALKGFKIKSKVNMAQIYKNN